MKAKGRETDEAAWCAALVLHCLRATREKVDYPAKPHRARSWETYGTPLAERKVGAVVVVSPTPGTRRRHVGFYLADEGDRVVLLGGNQDDQVNEKSYPGTNAVFRGLLTSWLLAASGGVQFATTNAPEENPE